MVLQIWLRPILGTRGLENLASTVFEGLHAKETEKGWNQLRESFARKAAIYHQLQKQYILRM